MCILLKIDTKAQVYVKTDYERNNMKDNIFFYISLFVVFFY